MKNTKNTTSMLVATLFCLVPELCSLNSPNDGGMMNFGDIHMSPRQAKDIGNLKKQADIDCLPKIEHFNSIEYAELMKDISKIQVCHSDIWSDNCSLYLGVNEKLDETIRAYLSFEKTDEKQLESRYRYLFEICRISRILAKENPFSVNLEHLFKLAAGKFNYLAYMLKNRSRYGTVQLPNYRKADLTKTRADLGKDAINLQKDDWFVFQAMDPYHSIDRVIMTEWRNCATYNAYHPYQPLSFMMWLEGQKIRRSAITAGQIIEMPLSDLINFASDIQYETNYDFVITPDFKIKLTPADGGCRHMGLSGGGRQMLFAGEIKFRNGEVYEITNGSGHYLPGFLQLQKVRDLFVEQSIISKKSSTYNNFKGILCVRNQLNDSERYNELVKDFKTDQVSKLRSNPYIWGGLDFAQQAKVNEISGLQTRPYEAFLKTANLTKELYAARKYEAAAELSYIFFDSTKATKLFYRLSNADRRAIAAVCVLSLHKSWEANPERTDAENNALMISECNVMPDENLSKIFSDVSYSGELRKIFEVHNICKFLYQSKYYESKFSPEDYQSLRKIGEGIIFGDEALKCISNIMLNLKKARHLGTIRWFINVFFDPAAKSMNANFERIDRQNKLNVISCSLDSLQNMLLAGGEHPIEIKKINDIYACFCAQKNLSESEDAFFIHQQMKNYNSADLLPSEIVFKPEFERQLTFIRNNPELYRKISSPIDQKLIVNILLNQEFSYANSNDIYNLLSHINVPYNYDILRKLTTALFDISGGSENYHFRFMTDKNKINTVQMAIGCLCDSSSREFAADKEKAKRLYENFKRNNALICRSPEAESLHATARRLIPELIYDQKVTPPAFPVMAPQAAFPVQNQFVPPFQAQPAQQQGFYVPGVAGGYDVSQSRRMLVLKSLTEDPSFRSFSSADQQLVRDILSNKYTKEQTAQEVYRLITRLSDADAVRKIINVFISDNNWINSNFTLLDNSQKIYVIHTAIWAFGAASQPSFDLSVNRQRAKQIYENFKTDVILSGSSEAANLHRDAETWLADLLKPQPAPVIPQVQNQFIPPFPGQPVQNLDFQQISPRADIQNPAVILAKPYQAEPPKLPVAVPAAGNAVLRADYTLSKREMALKALKEDASFRILNWEDQRIINDILSKKYTKEQDITHIYNILTHAIDQQNYAAAVKIIDAFLSVSDLGNSNFALLTDNQKLKVVHFAILGLCNAGFSPQEKEQNISRAQKIYENFRSYIPFKAARSKDVSALAADLKKLPFEWAKGGIVYDFGAQNQWNIQ